MQNLITLFDLQPDDIRDIFQRARDLKADLRNGKRNPILAGRVLTQVFQKPSLRTRLSFEAAMIQLGGGGIFISNKDSGLEGREATADVARVIGGYSDVIVLRTFDQSLIDEFGRHAGCAVVNGLSDESHPCQALTDLFTMQEVLGDLSGRKLAYVGDGNNVACSLARACAMLGVTFTVAAPKPYQLSSQILSDIQAAFPSADISQHVDPKSAVQNADIVYTDVWASMGQEDEKDQRKADFAHYQVNADLMSAARPDAKFMHCLPARRGLEVTDDVMDGPASLAFPQADNRMHLAKGLFAWLLDRS